MFDLGGSEKKQRCFVFTGKNMISQKQFGVKMTPMNLGEEQDWMKASYRKFGS